MSGIQLTDFHMEISMRHFLDIVWEKGDFLANFLEDEIQEKDVVISDWRNIASSDIIEKPVRYERTITSMHPLPISLPWLPLAISSTNIQTVEYDCSRLQLRILEISVIKGIPFVEPTIITEWTVKEPSPNICHVSINLKFSYKKASMLQALVESNSRSELLKFFELWQVRLSKKLLDLKVNNELHKIHELYQLANLLPVESPTIYCGTNNEEDKSSTPDLVSLTTVPSEKEYSEAPEAITSSLNFNSDTEKLPKYLPDVVAENRPETCREEEQIEINLNRNNFRNCLLNLNNVHVLEAFLILLRSNCLVKMIAAIIVNSYAKMDVAAYLHIEVTNIIRSMMDQAMSIVLIYCFILITEIIVGMVLVTSILSSIEDYDDIDNVIYYVDNIDRYILYKIFQESIFEVLNPSKISEKKLKNSAESVSVSTQTDDTIIYDTIIMNTCPTVDDNNTIIECPSCPANPIIQCTMPESETEEIPHEDEKINMLDTEISPDDNDSGKKFSQLMNNTWRDCQFSTIETFWTHLFVRT